MVRPHFLAVAALCGLCLPGWAQEPVRLREQFPANYQYHVSSRVEITGSLTPPGDMPDAKPIQISGSSAIEYDERVLAAEADARVSRALRIYRRIDLQRKVSDQSEDATLRQPVRRLVILRRKNAEVPFSPDGPLTWGEIELIRTDVFTPALAGLLPDRAVKPGERWPAGREAIQELTDLEQIEEGTIECKLEQVTNLGNRRVAQVALAGTVKGVNEDGPNRQQLDGHFFFDLDSNHLSYLSFRGVHVLLDKQGKEAGKIEGRFVLTRQANTRSTDLADDALRGVALEPNETNTLLLYDNPDLGVRLLYPRRWRVGAVQGRQLALDEAGGSGLLITLEPLTKLPTAAQFLAETQGYFQKQKARVLGTTSPQRIQSAPAEVEAFSLEVDVAGQRATMDYYVLRQGQGGAVLAARLLPNDLATVRREVEQLARGLKITAPPR